VSHASHLEASGPTYLWLATVPLTLFLLLAWGLASYPLPWRVDVPWIPSLSVSLAFRIDGLSAQMLALITGIGAWIFVYASGYLAHEPRRGRLFGVCCCSCWR
jgi:multicomponent Na+:H+ antiporter subunit A